ncbi:MAG: hypothetical protein IPJ25_11085 [Rhodocyclaceae bacterium]|nr:hypothetical protein [Rhodocyclaceae bacterium]
MNSDDAIPFYRGLKMLGRKTQPQEILTQGSFVKGLLRLISCKPERDTIAIKRNEEIAKEDSLPFNAFWRNGRDDLILTVMTNYFGAMRDTFPDQWDYKAYLPKDRQDTTPTPVLRRTVGYEALMRVLVGIWPEVRTKTRIDHAYFMERTNQFKENSRNISLTTEYFGSSSADAARLANIFLTGAEASD